MKYKRKLGRVKKAIDLGGILSEAAEYESTCEIRSLNKAIKGLLNYIEFSNQQVELALNELEYNNFTFAREFLMSINSGEK